jgi:pimeloyl-ACP methyl ester carboxylesterase
LYYAIQHSDKLNGIIALSPFAAFDDVREKEYQSMILKRRYLPGHEKGYNILSGLDNSYSAEERMQHIFPFYFHDTGKIPLFQKLSDTPISSKAGEYTSASGLGLDNLLPELHKIKVPALIVVGDDDYICDKVSQSDRIAAGIKASSEIVIKDAGHFSWVEQPEQFFKGCKDWLVKQGLRKEVTR